MISMNAESSGNSVGTIWEWFAKRLRALRAFSFPMSVLPVFIATAAVHGPGDWDIPVLIASALGMVLLHATGNLLNDYFDYHSGIDSRIHDDEGRPGRLLVRGELEPRDILIEAITCMLLAMPIAVYLIWKCGIPILILGIIAAAGLYSYTGPPLKLKYRAMGEVLIFFIFGLLPMIGTSYAQTGHIGLQVLLLALPVGFSITAVVVVNNIRDSDEDREAGIFTLAHIADGQVSRLLYAGLIILSPLALAIYGIFRLGPLAFIAAPLLLLLIIRPLTAVLSGKRLPDIDAVTARSSTVLMIFLLVILVINGGFRI